ncbi:hypothetical protein [Streptomyces spectabilis]|uniref:ABC-type Na+ transport system ATPase subunit NatA n=1 Tax=Streptomyces spectabilis TaxID=68270 RepID=A0A7W8AY81_STRST|nr:hypothetical protein [Streptomyces spectabilis]MBB5106854.1 ABC-type Na+ transport system ATPase subunit NatA [Streptomyces spectabilis]MCI3906415.1 hypothetical protein [Streptomyces spectabilis]GGV40792.1 hypothetical protein GCM10010245_64330 [Streptomyces spectabilis]
MRPGPDSRRFAVHDHRPGAAPAGTRPEAMALEVRRTDGGAAAPPHASGHDDRLLRVERHACLAVVSADDSADRFLDGLLDDDGGPGRAVAVHGVDPRTEPDAVRRLVGVVRSGMPLPEGAVHDALVGTALRQGLPPEAAVERATDLAAALGLRSVERTPVAALTPGQRSRTAVGCALLHVPKLLLLCRPLDDVDEVSEQVLHRVLGRYAASTGTVVFSTGSAEVARRMTDRLFMVCDGQVRCGSLPTAR